MRALAGVVLMLVLGSGVSAQQPAAPAGAPSKDAPSAAPTAATGTKDEQDRASLKARLERSIAENEQRLARLKDGLARLNKGEPTDAVRDATEPGRRPPGGPDGPSGARGGRRGGNWDGGQHHDGPPAAPDANDGKPDKEVVMAFLAEHNPEFAERINASLKDNPQMAERTIGRLAPHIREVLAERDEQTRTLKIAEMRNGWDTMGAMRKLTDALRKGPDGPEVQEQTGRLRELLGAQFDTQVKLRNREIAVLEERIGQIRKELGDRLSERETYINKQIEKLLKFARDRAAQPAHKDGEKAAAPVNKPA
jgi:hypothetical protein